MEAVGEKEMVGDNDGTHVGWVGDAAENTLGEEDLEDKKCGAQTVGTSFLGHVLVSRVGMADDNGTVDTLDLQGYVAGPQEETLVLGQLVVP